MGMQVVAASNNEDMMRTLWDNISVLVFPAEDTERVRAGIIAVVIVPCVP